MTRVNIADAQARLSELIDAALKSEDVVIARRNTPLYCRSLQPVCWSERGGGILRARSANFDSRHAGAGAGCEPLGEAPHTPDLLTELRI
jgi:antitoxin (DNA-binding transcriptional repressor) of toxin-antitoxin stability system